MRDQKMNIRKLVLFLAVVSCILLLVAFIPDSAFAQPGMPSEPTQTPIDGGLSILAALGGGYAIKKLRDKD